MEATRAKEKKKPKWNELIGDGEHATIYRVRDYETDAHLMPDYDVIEHLPSANCPCNPQLDAASVKAASLVEGGCVVWVHKDLQEEVC